MENYSVDESQFRLEGNPLSTKDARDSDLTKRKPRLKKYKTVRPF